MNGTPVGCRLGGSLGDYSVLFLKNYLVQGSGFGASKCTYGKGGSGFRVLLFFVFVVGWGLCPKSYSLIAT